MDEISLQLNQMRTGVEQSYPVSCKGWKIFMRPLTIHETLKLEQNVAEQFKSMPDTAKTQANLHKMLAVEMLLMASAPEVGGQPSVSQEFINNWTPEELAYIHKQYVDITDKCNPALESLSKDEIIPLIEEVKKNPIRLAECSFLQLRSMVELLTTGG